ncbi:hypothetical protein MIR68_002186 [Amoeboaphelidium protococcarum]|nr:hypothetical protein MIR68_002186 [Amoeboaphelidium protococcarum]
MSAVSNALTLEEALLKLSALNVNTVTAIEDSAQNKILQWTQMALDRDAYSDMERVLDPLKTLLQSTYKRLYVIGVQVCKQLYITTHSIDAGQLLVDKLSVEYDGFNEYTVTHQEVVIDLMPDCAFSTEDMAHITMKLVDRAFLNCCSDKFQASQTSINLLAQFFNSGHDDVGFYLDLLLKMFKDKFDGLLKLQPSSPWNQLLDCVKVFSLVRPDVLSSCMDLVCYHYLLQLCNQRDRMVQLTACRVIQRLYQRGFQRDLARDYVVSNWRNTKLATAVLPHCTDTQSLLLYFEQFENSDDSCIDADITTVLQSVFADGAALNVILNHDELSLLMQHLLAAMIQRALDGSNCRAVSQIVKICQKIPKLLLEFEDSVCDYLYRFWDVDGGISQSEAFNNLCDIAQSVIMVQSAQSMRLFKRLLAAASSIQLDESVRIKSLIVIKDLLKDDQVYRQQCIDFEQLKSDLLSLVKSNLENVAPQIGELTVEVYIALLEQEQTREIFIEEVLAIIKNVVTNIEDSAMAQILRVLLHNNQSHLLDSNVQTVFEQCGSMPRNSAIKSLQLEFLKLTSNNTQLNSTIDNIMKSLTAKDGLMLKDLNDRQVIELSTEQLSCVNAQLALIPSKYEELTSFVASFVAPQDDRNPVEDDMEAEEGCQHMDCE